MRIIRRAAGPLFLRAVLCSFLLGVVCAGSMRAQKVPDAAAGAASKQVPGKEIPADKAADSPIGGTSASGLHGTATLDGPWKFHTGDDPMWAEPTLDDSSWPTVNLNLSL